MKSIPILIVALTIGIIMVTSAIIPLVTDYSESKTFTNEGYFHMEKLTPTSDDVSMYWDYTNPYKITVGSDTIDLPQSSAYPLSLEAESNWGLRYMVAGGDVGLSVIGPGGIVFAGASVSGTTNLTITLSGGTATFFDGTNTHTRTYTSLYNISGDDGAYIMKKSTDKSYVLGDSVIFSTGRTYTAGGNVNINLSGTINDGFTADVFAPADTYTAYNYQVSDTSVSGYENLYQFEKVDFKIRDGSNNSYDVSYSQVIVPYQVTTYPDNPPIYRALVSLIPMMAFICLVVAGAALIYSKGREL